MSPHPAVLPAPAPGLTIDGREGEGGGQVLRSALSLSMATGTPFSIHHVRGGRRRPGLLRQHLTAVRAAAALCGATVEGARLGSDRLRFAPGPLRAPAAPLEVMVGSAGSAMLVVQAVAPALLARGVAATLVVGGGTHNPAAPSHEVIAEAWAPALAAMGAQLTTTLERPGFFPAGGGRCQVALVPWTAPRPFVAAAPPGPAVELWGEILLAQLPARIAAAERARVVARMAAAGRPISQLRVRRPRDSAGPGNTLTLHARWPGGRLCVLRHGRKGLASEAVADAAVDALLHALDAGAAVDDQLADQLLLPMALGAGGHFTTTAPTGHTRTNAALIQRFLPVDIAIAPETPDRWRVTVGPRGSGPPKSR